MDISMNLSILLVYVLSDRNCGMTELISVDDNDGLEDVSS